MILEWFVSGFCFCMGALLALWIAHDFLLPLLGYVARKLYWWKERFIHWNKERRA